jgi:hypothetical protein
MPASRSVWLRAAWRRTAVAAEGWRPRGHGADRDRRRLGLSRPCTGRRLRARWRGAALHRARSRRRGPRCAMAGEACGLARRGPGPRARRDLLVGPPATGRRGDQRRRHPARAPGGGVRRGAPPRTRRAVRRVRRLRCRPGGAGVCARCRRRCGQWLSPKQGPGRAPSAWPAAGVGDRAAFAGVGQRRRQCQPVCRLCGAAGAGLAEGRAAAAATHPRGRRGGRHPGAGACASRWHAHGRLRRPRACEPSRLPARFAAAARPPTRRLGAADAASPVPGRRIAGRSVARELSRRRDRRHVAAGQCSAGR